MSETVTAEGLSRVWKQFTTARTKLLSEYDRALEHAREQAVPVHHGVVGEAAVRRWLGEFLPKRYGVTAGYVKAEDPKMQKSAHFDVIIYDQLEAPVLWTESNPDKSDAGRSRVIPVEYVYGVIEVKAALTRQTLQDAFRKLKELDVFCRDEDAAAERYKRFLPRNAVLSPFFFELREENARELAILDLVRDFSIDRQLLGPIVLRGSARRAEESLFIRRLLSGQAMQALCPGKSLFSDLCMTEAVTATGGFLLADVEWSDINFSRYAFDLIAMMRGTYQSNLLSSMHAIDMTGR